MISIVRTNRLADAVLAFEVVKGLKNLYPGLGFWYNNKVVPGIVTGEDILIVAKDRDKIVGVSLGKKRDYETKLRMVRVDPEYQKSGLGLKLVDKMLVALDCDKPFCTVSEEMLHDFSRPFINKYKFTLSTVQKGMYRPRKLEYVFNEPEAGASNIDETYFAPSNIIIAPEELELHTEVFSHLAPR